MNKLIPLGLCRTNAGPALWVQALVLLLSWCAIGLAGAATSKLSKEDLACLRCHDKPDLSRLMDNGKSLSLHISTEAMVQSVHNGTACEDCHADLDAKTHGKVRTPLASHRAYTLSMQEACRTCHKKKFTQYDDSVHASLAKAGDDKAPVCSDCHNPHTVRAAQWKQADAPKACAGCHENISRAASLDVHGQPLNAMGKPMPVCADCHQAHAVKAAALGEGIKDACLTCHQNAVATHREWLPNTERHFTAVACAVCHAPSAPRRVNLRLYDVQGQHQVSEKIGVPQFERLTDGMDAQNAGLDERALWSLLQAFNRNGADGKTSLHGRLELRSGVQAHQMGNKSVALKDCKVCHRAGAAAFQSVNLSMVGPDGRLLRHDVRKDVLQSLTSMESVRGFYAIGSTRIHLLDQLLVLVLAGAISVPLGHMGVKRLFRRMREQLEAERKSQTQSSEDSSRTPKES